MTGSWCDDRPLRRSARRQVLPPGRLPQLRLAGRRLRHAGWSPTRSTPAAARRRNRGTYLRFADGAFVRMPGAGASFRPSGAFAAPDSGWLEGPVEISAKQAPQRLQPWPVALRAPLADVAAAPGAAPGATGSGALAVGADGAVLRYEPGSRLAARVPALLQRQRQQGDPARRRLAGTAARARGRRSRRDVDVERRRRPLGSRPRGADRLRGQPDGRRLRSRQPRPRLRGRQGRRAARLRQELGSDGAAVRLRGDRPHLDRLRRQPGDRRRRRRPAGQRRRAAGASTPPPTRCSTRSAPAIRSSVAVAGLPDGGAVAAGRDIVIERDGPGAPWRFSDQPLPGSTAIAAAAVRDGGRVRAVVSVVPQLTYPPADDLPEPDPNVPPPILPPFSLPGDGYLLRETARRLGGRAAHVLRGLEQRPPAEERPGALPAARSRRQRLGGRRLERRFSRLRRAAAPRRAAAAAEPIRERVRRRRSSATATAASADRGRPVRRCRCRPDRCGWRSPATPSATPPAPSWRAQPIGPDRNLAAAVRTVAGDAPAATARGPCSTPATGSRAGLGSADAARYAQLLGSAPSLPVFPALGSNDVADGAGAADFAVRLRRLPGPARLRRPRRPGSRPPASPARRPIPAARTHYAFDSSGPGRDRAGDRDRQLAWLAGRQRPPPEPGRGAAAVAGSGARRRPREGHPDGRDGQSQPQPQLHAEAQRRLRRRPGRPGPGRRWRLRLPLRSPRREPGDPDPGRLGDDDPELRGRHARLPLADQRRRRAWRSRTALFGDSRRC